MKSLIKKILKESKDERLVKLKTNIASTLKPPYLRNLNQFGFNKRDFKSILSLIFKKPIEIIEDYGTIDIYDKKDNQLYSENTLNPEDEDYGVFKVWERWEYNQNGDMIYHENSEGYWMKWEYDEKGNEIYFEDSDGEWNKTEYDERGNEIYNEGTNGWTKYEHDERGNITYFEDSNGRWGKYEYGPRGVLINTIKGKK